MHVTLGLTKTIRTKTKFAILNQFPVPSLIDIRCIASKMKHVDRGTDILMLRRDRLMHSVSTFQPIGKLRYRLSPVRHMQIRILFDVLVT